MFCSNCGTKIEGGDKFCKKCGREQNAITTDNEEVADEKNILESEHIYNDDMDRADDKIEPFTN